MRYILFFVLGISVGSFLNVLIFRTRRGKGILGRSYCPKCGKNIKWYDLAPVLSFFILKARCRNCKAKISPIYPVVELATGFLFLAFAFFNPTLTTPEIVKLAIIALFICLFFFDYLHFILPDKIIFALLALGVLRQWQSGFENLSLTLVSALIMAAIFAILYLVSKGRWMGFGDVKLVAAIGIILGYPFSVLTVILSIWIAAILGLILIFFGRAGLKTALPFGSFLSLISIIFLIFYHDLQTINRFF